MRHLLFGLMAVAAAAQTPTFEQTLSLRRGVGQAISPDGRFVAYGVQKTNWDENAYETEIWIAVTATGERRRLTGGKKSSSGPVWAPDGKRLAFASDRDGQRQIYLISPTGGEAVQLLNHETAVGDFAWTPDGKALLFTAPEPESKSLKERKDKFGEFQTVKGDYTFTHLWTVNVPLADELNPPKTKAERLTEGNSMTVGGFAISPDGKRVAFSAKKDPDLSSEPSDIYVLNLADKFVKKLVDQRGPDSNPVWSPDGTRIAFETANAEEFYYYKNSHVAVVPAEGGKPSVLAPDFDEQPQLIAWGPDGIYFSAFQRTTRPLFRLAPATGAVERVSGPGHAVIGGVSFTKAFDRAAFSASFDGRFSEVHVSGMTRFEPKALTNFADQLREFKLATREVVEWKSTDGTPIEGILIKPADFDPAKKYPLLVVIHGGPTGIDLPVLSPHRIYPIERFVAKDALVLQPNYRGSAGYGEKFRSLNVRNLGIGDAWDVLSGVDYLVARGWVNKERVGAMGWSQGGYISAFLTTSTTRFKAVSVGAGISNWTTYYANTDIHPFTRQYLKATPWADPEIYSRTSPMTYIRNAKTPTLIQHGEFDRRVPIPNAYELFQGLEDQGVPVRMYVYKGFGHGITKPKEQRAAMEHNYEFFSEYIWGEKPPK